jgi:hypothetical protein
MSDMEHVERARTFVSRHPSRVTLRHANAVRLVCNVLPDLLMLIVMGAFARVGVGAASAEEAE